MRSRCIIDGKVVDHGQQLCDDHIRAMHKVRDGFEDWQKAMGSLTIDDYLHALLKDNVPTGKWVREVVEFMIDGKLDFKESTS